jgi:hypothetical protein
MITNTAYKPRIQFEGAFYHIIVRGNQRPVCLSAQAGRIFPLTTTTAAADLNNCKDAEQSAALSFTHNRKPDP